MERFNQELELFKEVKLKEMEINDIYYSTILQNNSRDADNNNVTTYIKNGLNKGVVTLNSMSENIKELKNKIQWKTDSILQKQARINQINTSFFKWFINLFTKKKND
ncbi:MAG: hypothetical protein IC227_06495 [Enterococcus lacertideformus]|uniref:Uncharacterized protein n=1 Tax=Enterococcus lacertideformus TaxID=2771493 RepID=A0A931B0A7_9ENTE|nr:hypothetical protein [Enterococcus lacertideformus]